MILHVLAFWRRPAPLQRARKARLDALTAVSEAKRRGDTRTQHEASQRARVATHEVIRLELRRPVSNCLAASTASQQTMRGVGSNG